jgi:hypothetical protein
MRARKGCFGVLSTASLLAVWACNVQLTSPSIDGGTPAPATDAAIATDAGPDTQPDGSTAVACPILTSTSGSITDSAGNVWTLVVGPDGSLVIYLNGSYSLDTDHVVELIEVGGVIYQENSAGGWWSWTNGAWAPTSKPTAACTDAGSSSDGGTSLPSFIGKTGRGVAMFDSSYWGANAPAASYNYMASQGVNVVRLPINWDTIQPTLGGPLSTASRFGVPNIQHDLDAALASGIKIWLDIHSSFRHGSNVAGDGVLTPELFADLWLKMSAQFGSHPALAGYDLMNERKFSPRPVMT